MLFDLNFVCQTLIQELPELNVIVNKINIDSREKQEGCVFLALKGERFDAHDFVADVLARGALAAIVHKDFPLQDARLIRVDDTLQALGALAHAWRMKVNPKVFGITGSSGKTTVKEMLTGILREFAREDAVLSTQGNFNNEIGLPLTLLSLKPEHRFAVIEMGMNHFGELSRLTKIACPDIALVNNAQRVHIGCGFDGVGDIAKAKSEIYQGLPENGMGIYPFDDEYAQTFINAIEAHKKVSFGLKQGDRWVDNIQMNPLSSEFNVHDMSESQKIILPIAGEHNIRNALAAITIALEAGVPLEKCVSSLQKFKNIKGRLQEKVSKYGARIIDDTYNANPDSMKAAINVLAQFSSPRVLVMGDLGELGDTAPELHAEVGAYAKEMGIEYFFTLGALSQNACQAYGDKAQNFTDVADIIHAVEPLLDQDITVLVKGSRFMKMERVVDALL